MPDRITGSADHWILSVDGATAWRNAAPLPNPRGHASGVEIGGMIYVVGGALPHDPTPYDITAVHVYDPVANTWRSVADTPRPLSHAEPSTFALDGQIIVVVEGLHIRLWPFVVESVVRKADADDHEVLEEDRRRRAVAKCALTDGGRRVCEVHFSATPKTRDRLARVSGQR